MFLCQITHERSVLVEGISTVFHSFHIYLTNIDGRQNSRWMIDHVPRSNVMALDGSLLDWDGKMDFSQQALATCYANVIILSS